MSPVGLEVREYAYGIREFTVPDAATYTMTPTFGGTTVAGWFVTKILAAMPSDAAGQGAVLIDGNTATVNPGGCQCLEPGGAHRGPIVLIGEGLYVLVEYWWQGNPEATGPVVNVT